MNNFIGNGSQRSCRAENPATDIVPGVLDTSRNDTQAMGNFVPIGQWVSNRVVVLNGKEKGNTGQDSSHLLDEDLTVSVYAARHVPSGTNQDSS